MTAVTPSLLEDVRGGLGLSKDEMADLLGMSTRNYYRLASQTGPMAKGASASVALWLTQTWSEGGEVQRHALSGLIQQALAHGGLSYLLSFLWAEYSGHPLIR